MRRVVSRLLPVGLTLLAGLTLVLPIGVPGAAAQGNPTVLNIIPDGGTGAIEGKVQSVDPISRQITVVAGSGKALDLVAGPSIRLDNIEPGDSVDARYNRTVLWVVTPPSASVPPGATEDLTNVARTPGIVGSGAAQISGRVIKIDPGHSFDVVDATGGAVYTIVVTDPGKIAMLPALKVGTGITVSLSPLMISSMEKCGWFGCL
jgi:hypothetical protein